MHTTRVWVLIFSMLSGVSISADRTTSSAPSAWWEVTTSDKKQVRAVGFLGDDLVFVESEDRAVVRSGTMKVLGPGRWMWTHVLGGPKILCSLEIDARARTARLTCSEGNRHEAFTLREAIPQRAREFAALAAAKRPASGICNTAGACCTAAFALLGARCDLNAELGNPRDAEKCDAFMKGIHMIFEAKNLHLPAACAP